MVEISEDLVETLRLYVACFHSVDSAANFFLPSGFDLWRKVLIRFRNIEKNSSQGQALTRGEFQRIFCNF